MIGFLSIEIDPLNVSPLTFRVIHDDQSAADVKTKLIPAISHPFSTQYRIPSEILLDSIIYLSEQLLRISTNTLEDYFFAPQTAVTIQLKKCFLIMKNEGVHVGKRRLPKP